MRAKITPFLLFNNEADEAADFYVSVYWNAVIAGGGEESQCGWLKDKFGVSWQVAPEILPRLMKDAEPKKSSAVMQTMMKMKKISAKQRF